PDIPYYDYLPPPNGFAQPNGINDDGVIAGNVSGFPFGTLAYIWHPDSQAYSFFTAPAASEANTFPAGVNKQGQVVGNYFSWAAGFFKFQSFLKTSTGEDCDDRSESGEFETINVPGAYGTIAAAINNRGTIAGSYFTSVSTYGYVRTRTGAISSVNYPGYAGTSIYGINDQGAICGNSFTNAGLNQGFVAYPSAGSSAR
ncbi:MAG: hypothetical protein JO270_08975, partial [Acidobacteriaceae bacterium]|nr:hypothetical protein [Acidobacteriaceae bacterium]